MLELRYFIIVAFAHEDLDKLPPAHIELRKYDESVQDYVPLPLDTILEENVQIKVELTGDQVKCTVISIYNIDRTLCALWLAKKNPCFIKVCFNLSFSPHYLHIIKQMKKPKPCVTLS